MAEDKTHIRFSSKIITPADLLGLWEVLRIDIGGEGNIYPWIQGRFIFHFTDEKSFVCIKERQHFDGSWQLQNSDSEDKNLYAILFNETFEFVILELDEDEMILFDRSNKYILSRKF